LKKSFVPATTEQKPCQHALLLAAGVGSRMGELTANQPKALIEVADKSLLARNIEKLYQSGITQLVVNVHHHAEKIITYLENVKFPCLTIYISDERQMLLDTGGALKKAAPFFENAQNILVANVDILSDIDFAEMAALHSQKKALVTLAVRDRITTRYLWFESDSLRLQGWSDEKNGLQKGDCRGLKRAFSGIQIVSADIFEHFPKKEKFSSIELYLELAEKHSIVAFDHSDGAWFDVGTPEKLAAAEAYYMKVRSERHKNKQR
jgi:N-acetyl-alpha-D-muramate 1-phosphate uridylyltransferase